MDHPEGAGSQRADPVDFDRRVDVEFRGAQFSPNSTPDRRLRLVQKSLSSSWNPAILTPNGTPLGKFRTMPNLSRIRSILALTFLCTFNATALHAQGIEEARNAYIDALITSFAAEAELHELRSDQSAADSTLNEIRSAIEAEEATAVANAVARLQADRDAADQRVAEAMALAEAARTDMTRAREARESISAAVEQIPQDVQDIQAAITDGEAQIAEFDAAAASLAQEIEAIEARIANAQMAEQEKQQELADAQTMLGNMQADMDSLRYMAALATAPEGFDNVELAGWVRDNVPLLARLWVLRDSFAAEFEAILEEDDAIAAPVQRGIMSVFGLPNGPSYLVWDARNNRPFDPRETSAGDYFENLAFLRVVIDGDVLVRDQDLERVAPDDVSRRDAWPDPAQSDFESCRDAFGVSPTTWINQFCQAMHPESALFGLQVWLQNDSTTEASVIILSGERAYFLVQRHAAHVEALRRTLEGEIPDAILPVLQEDFVRMEGLQQEQLDNQSNLVARLDRELGELAAESADLTLSHAVAEARQVQDQRDTLAADLDAMRAELDALVANHAQRYAANLAEAEAAEITAQRALENALAAESAASEALAAIDATMETVATNARSGVARAWQDRLAAATGASESAKVAMNAAETRLVASSSALVAARDSYASSLAAAAIERRVYFDLRFGSQICLQIRNISDHYVDVTVGDLRFREAVFPLDRISLLAGIAESPNESWTRFSTSNTGNGDLSFPNRYREDIAGLQPGQIFDVCLLIADPAEGDLGRYFDQLGGFETVGWDIDLTVRLGTFVDTDRAITFIPSATVFAEQIATAVAEAREQFEAEIEL